METELDFFNRVTACELDHLLRLQLRELARDPASASLLPPLMVWGAPGLGKSSILKEVADSLGIGFIDVRLAQREPVDIRGLPVPGEDGVKWLVASEWPRDPASRGIILFDEITAADRSLQVAAYEFILDRRLGELYQVPPGWYVCAAGNRVGDRAVASTMSSALANRFLHVELGEDVESWIRWAQGHGIPPEVMGFIRFKPTALFHQEGENLERGWPSPRSWERVGRMLSIMEGEDGELVRKMVYGLVGQNVGVEFMEFRAMSAAMADVKGMMTDPSAPVEIPKGADKLYSFCSALSYYLWRGESAEDGARRLDGFFRICLRLPGDFAAMAMRDAMGGTAKEPDKEAMEKLFRHHSYRAWADLHGKALRKYMAAR